MSGTHPTGPIEPVEVVASVEPWNEYTLSDGNVLRLKVVVTDIVRVTGQRTTSGEPVYSVNFAPIISVRELQSPPEKQGGVN